MFVYLLFTRLSLGLWLTVSGLGFKQPKDYEGGLVWVLICCVGVFRVWAIDNLLGIFSGLRFSIGYGFVLLVGLTLWLWSEVPKPLIVGRVNYLSHFRVIGVRGLLGLVLPLMETFRILIRPLTLRVRLSTNITSGHVLLTLVGLLGGRG